MSALIAAVMVILLAALAFRVVTDPGWLVCGAAVLAGVPILLALVRTVPNAVRLGKRVDAVSTQTRLARSVFRDHVVCFLLMLAFVVLLLAV